MAENEDLKTKVERLIEQHNALVEELRRGIIIRDEIINDLRGQRKNVFSV